MDDLINVIKGKKILVTGGTGYLATGLIAQLQDVDCSIIRLSRPDAHFIPMAGKPHVQDVVGDIRKPEIWESVLANVDIVFHLAAQTSVYIAEKNLFADMESNVLPMIYLLETCRKRNLNLSVIFAGTATEFGLSDHMPVDETHPDHPITVYDLHKWMAENYLKYYTRTGVVQGVTLRLANVYGPGTKSSSADRGVLTTMIRKALKGEALTVYGKGDYLRDYVYIDDVVRAFLYAAVNIERVSGQHFLIGSGEKNTIAGAFNLIADRVALRTGTRVPVVHVDIPESLSPIESRNFVADTKSFNQAVNWLAECSFVDGIDRTIESYLHFS
jgi:nucleoside-diphosphate-sugar epimerase